MAALRTSSDYLPEGSDLRVPELLEIVEEALVLQRPFGDSSYIRQQYEASFLRRLKIIASRLPGAQQLLSVLKVAEGQVLHRVTSNTVVRCAIQHAHTQVETDDVYGLPLEACDEIFDRTAAHLHAGALGTPLENGAFYLPRLGDEPHYGWIWREDYPDDLFGRSFRFLIERDYGDALAIPGQHDIASLQQGERLLRTLLPRLTPSALSHVYMIGIFPHSGSWRDKASSSQIRLGGSIFLGTSLLRSPWVVAEHLLHEALHQKLYDFRHGHTLLEEDFSHRGAPRVRAPWNSAQLNDANSWDAHRAFAAFHVYVQLYLLARVAKEREPGLDSLYGSSSGMTSAERAFGRAWYLGEQLKETCWGVMGDAGRRLLDWLMFMLEALQPSLPPQNARIHLLLDLYCREGKKVDAALGSGSSAPPALLAKTLSLARRELEAARSLLTVAARDEHAERLSVLRDRYESGDPTLRFGQLREAIAAIILDASDDGYILGVPTSLGPDPNELVDDMVTTSSQQLHELLNGLPSLVARAKQRAYSMRFNASCIDDVGRLLATLAAAVPWSGRILEIGTGVGVGTGWLCTGLGSRTDVEVISIEIDAELSKAAGREQWPSYVNLLNADLLAVCGTLDTFDLIFLDASPVKYGHLEETLALLRINGVIVIDDLRMDMKNTATQLMEKGELTRAILHHPTLQAIELDWASGVLLATRVATDC